MITKQELEKLKDLAGKSSADSYKFISDLGDSYGELLAILTPQTVLRLIEALEFATETLKRHYIIECIYCVGDGITEEAPNFQNAYGEHGLHTKECLLCRPAKEALNKIYGPA